MQKRSDFGLIPAGHTDIVGRMVRNHRKHDERFRARGVSGGKGKGVSKELYGARVADRWCRDRNFRS